MGTDSCSPTSARDLSMLCTTGLSSNDLHYVAMVANVVRAAVGRDAENDYAQEVAVYEDIEIREEDMASVEQYRLDELRWKTNGQNP